MNVLRPIVLLATALLLPACRTDCRAMMASGEPLTVEDPPLVCPVELPADVHEAERAACTFGAGAMPSETLGVPAALSQQLPIRHVIVVMKENRSFDHLLGGLSAQNAQVEPVPANFSNLDARGASVMPHRAGTTCLKTNPQHQWAGMHRVVNGGAMDGFVRNAASLVDDGHAALAQFTAEDLPFYHWLANTWALNDRHFASLRSGTFPNRDFLLLATNDGVRETGTTFPNAKTPTLFDSLDAAGLTWAVYSDGEPLSGALGWSSNHRGCSCLEDLFARLESGKLPNVVFVDATPEKTDDHPPADVQRGEAWLRDLYVRVTASPQWPRTAMIWAYDEGGGFFDHVPPPDQACVARPGLDDAFHELGPRVPLVVISPYAKPHFVSHVVQEHTAITRFIETLFALPALTSRDANSPALLDAFDFSCSPPMLSPPPPPEAGTNGCH